NSKRLVAIYTDGNRSSSTVDITGDNLSNNLPLTAGWSDGWTSTQSTLFITDIKIYNTALSDAYIANKGANVGLEPTSVYYNHVIGYWPGTDGMGLKFKDESGHGNDMIFNVTSNNKNKYGWNDFSDLTG